MEKLSFTIIELLMSIVGFFAVLILNDLRKSVKEAKDSVEKLNINIAVVVKTIDYHDERINRLEQKIQGE